MDIRKRAREAGGTLGSLAVELAATKLSEKYGWGVVLTVGLLGLAPLAIGWWPVIQKALADHLGRRGSPSPTLPGRIVYVEGIKDGVIQLHLSAWQKRSLRIFSWCMGTMSVILVLASIAVLVEIVNLDRVPALRPLSLLRQNASLVSFPPPAWAMKNSDGSPRIFVHETVAHLMGRFRDETALQAEDAAKPFLGKWIAIAGTVAEIKRTFGDVTVRLEEGTSPPVFPTFTGTQIDNLKVYNAGDRFRAVCKIAGLSTDYLLLAECQVVPS